VTGDLPNTCVAALQHDTADVLADPEANRRAWADVEFADRYRDHLDTRQAADGLAGRLADGESLAA